MAAEIDAGRTGGRAPAAVLAARADAPTARAVGFAPFGPSRLVLWVTELALIRHQGDEAPDLWWHAQWNSRFRHFASLGRDTKKALKEVENGRDLYSLAA